jgi:hypothetical protein
MEVPYIIAADRARVRPAVHVELDIWMHAVHGRQGGRTPERVKSLSKKRTGQVFIWKWTREASLLVQARSNWIASLLSSEGIAVKDSGSTGSPELPRQQVFGQIHELQRLEVAAACWELPSEPVVQKVYTERSLQSWCRTSPTRSLLYSHRLTRLCMSPSSAGKSSSSIAASFY